MANEGCCQHSLTAKIELRKWERIIAVNKEKIARRVNQMRAYMVARIEGKSPTTQYLAY